MRKNHLLAHGFEPTTFRLMSFSFLLRDLHQSNYHSAPAGSKFSEYLGDVAQATTVVPRACASALRVTTRATYLLLK